MTPFQEQAAKAIVNVFETGRLKGDYARVTVAANDLGHLSYGRSQTSLASGNLHVLIKKYCETLGAQFAADLAAFLPRLNDRDLTLDDDMNLRQILGRAGADPTMQKVQDAFFDDAYWKPAERNASALKLTTALGVTTVYDSIVHGNFHAMKAQTNASFGANPAEQDWIARYISIRRAWLANHSNVLLRKTVYRMDSLKELVDAAKFDLAPPFTVRGITVTSTSFDAATPDSQGEEPPHTAATDPEQIVLMLRRPYQRGSAVQYLQSALIKEQLQSQTSADGVFGPLTAELVKEFQRKHGLVVDGVVGAATWSVVNDIMAS